MDNRFEVTIRIPVRHVVGGAPSMNSSIWERRVWIVSAATETDAHEIARRALLMFQGTIDSVKEV